MAGEGNLCDKHEMDHEKDELRRELDEARASVAALRESESKFRILFETMGQGFVECEIVRDETGKAVDYRFLAINPAFQRLTKLDVAGALGRTAREVFPGVEDWWIEAFDRVVRSGAQERVENENADIGSWFEANIYPAGGERFIVLYEDITVRKRAEQVLRESEERQAFLLKLSDALRPLTDPVELRSVACRALGETLAADRVYYVENEADQGHGFVAGDYSIPELPGLAGRYPYDSFRTTYDRLGTGHTWSVDDVAVDKSLDKSERDFFLAQGVVGWIDVPLLKGGRLHAVLCVAQTHARVWTPAEISLVDEVADRLWAAIERGRAEAALRDSEERFAQFADASSVGLWMRDSDTLEMEYVSPAVSGIYGVTADAILGDIKRWASMVVPEDREPALEHLKRARAGDSAVHEFRIRRPDGSFRWIRNTDFPLRNADGKTERIGGLAEDVTEAKQAVEHQGVLLHELQHRVRNILAMLRSVANRSATGPQTVEDYRTILEGRLLTIARVQALLTREANAGGSLRDILQTEIGAMAHGGNEVTLSGPDVTLSPKALEVLSLAFHELATNALKYGALSTPTGTLSVTWQPFERRGARWLAVDWVEHGAPARAPSSRRGFGSELIEGRIPYELGGSGRVSIGPGGASCRMEFPLAYAESILETDAPSRPTIFGGTLDMTGAPNLGGQRILVVEDDYYSASDTAAALSGAGAEVLGPCPTEEATLKLLDSGQPTAAVVDLNLGGGGPRFQIASALKNRGIPFVFLTGYDPDVIPPEMSDVPCLQKPVPLREVIEAVSRLGDEVVASA